MIVDVWEHEAHQCELLLVRQDPGNGLVLDQQKKKKKPLYVGCRGLNFSPALVSEHLGDIF